MPIDRRWAAFGALMMLTAVGLGAFGAHGLKNTIPADRLEVFQTGVHYQAMHALGILAVAGLSAHCDGRVIRWVWRLFATGILVFSGSLYGLAVTGMKWLGAITPIGGLCFLLGWLLLAQALLRGPKD